MEQRQSGYRVRSLRELFLRRSPAIADLHNPTAQEIECLGRLFPRDPSLAISFSIGDSSTVNNNDGDHCSDTRSEMEMDEVLAGPDLELRPGLKEHRIHQSGRSVHADSQRSFPLGGLI